MEKNLEIKIAERDGTFIYALGPGGTNSFQAHIQASGPDALTLEERQELARMLADAPETAAEIDHLRAVNAELLEALEPFAKFACDTPHVNEPDCYNCRARAAISRARG